MERVKLCDKIRNGIYFSTGLEELRVNGRFWENLGGSGTIWDYLEGKGRMQELSNTRIIECSRLNGRIFEGRFCQPVGERRLLSVVVVGLAAEDGHCAVELFDEEQANHFMGEGHL